MRIIKLIILSTFLFNSTAYPYQNISDTLRVPLMTNNGKGSKRLKDTKSPSVDAKTIANITGWLIDNIEKATRGELNEVLPVLAEHLKGLKALGLGIQDEEIDKIMQGIIADRLRPRKEWKTVKFFKGELADIVDGKDTEITVTEIGFAHILGLKHRTANAFVMTPQGKLLIQRRAPGRKYPLYLSIFGGHLKAGQNYEQGIKEELVQELHLPEGTELKGGVGFLNKEDYEEAGVTNKEFRGLYVYQLTQEEYAKVMEYSKGLEEEKARRTEDEFGAWLSASDAKSKGFGEVWGYYEIDVNGIEGAKKETIWVADDKRDIDLHYIEIVDIFKDSQKRQNAHFTPDLLERIVRKGGIVSKLESPKLASGQNIKPPFDNPKAVGSAINEGSIGMYDGIIESWDIKMTAGNVFKYKVDKEVERKRVGRLRAMFNPGRSAKPKPPDVGISMAKVDADFSIYRSHNPEERNYNRINESEVVAEGLDLKGVNAEIIVNIFPFVRGHVLITPDRKKGHNQYFIPKAATVALEALRKINRKSYKITYNSWGAFGSVNHLHLQGLDYEENSGEEKMPVEGAKRNPPFEREGVSVSTLSDWLLKGFVLTSDNAEALSSKLIGLTTILHRKNQPFNIIFTYDGSKYDVYVLPRKYEKLSVSKLGTGVAYLEVGGEVLFVKQEGKTLEESKQIYDESTKNETNLADEIAAVGLDESSFKAIADQFASPDRLIKFSDIELTPVLFLDTEVVLDSNNFKDTLAKLNINKGNIPVILLIKETKDSIIAKLQGIDLTGVQFRTPVELGLQDLKWDKDERVNLIDGIANISCIPLTNALCEKYKNLQKVRDQV